MSALCQAVACDFGCNVSFPASENSVVLWQNVVGTVGITCFNLVFKHTAKWSTVPFAYSFLFIVIFTSMSLLLGLYWNGSYKRDEASEIVPYLEILESPTGRDGKRHSSVYGTEF